MRLATLTVAAICATSPVLACAPGEDVFMSCTIKSTGKYLEACNDADRVWYRFGKADETAELELSVPLEDAEYFPWPGVGRSIAEGITFRNGDYSYAVYAGFDRMYEGDPEDLERSFGGVRIMRGETRIAEAICDPSTVDFGWSPALWDAMLDAGLQWDYADQVWRPVP